MKASAFCFKSASDKGVLASADTERPKKTITDIKILNGSILFCLTLAITGDGLGAQCRVWRPCEWHCYVLFFHDLPNANFPDPRARNSLLLINFRVASLNLFTLSIAVNTCLLVDEYSSKIFSIA